MTLKISKYYLKKWYHKGAAAMYECWNDEQIKEYLVDCGTTFEQFKELCRQDDEMAREYAGRFAAIED